MNKAVVQALPTYLMSIQKLPVSFCHDLDAAVWRFWRIAKPDRRHYLSLTSWDKLCKPLNDRG